MKNLKITVNGTVYDVQVEEANGAAAPVDAAPSAPAAAPAPKASAPDGAEAINAPMPGTIVSVNVSAGQKIAKGDVLIVLEAMKMENEIMAPHDGVVASVNVSKGESVNSGTLLVSLQ